MSSGSNLAITYEEVAAYQAEQGIAMYADGSGGYTTGGIFIMWDREGGFTGQGWMTKVSGSPTAGLSEDDIQTEIDNYNNINNIFSKWVQTVDYETRYTWIFTNIGDNCRYEVMN